MFFQSNLGVVTKAGIWLMPQPPATTTISIKGLEDDDLEWLAPRLISLRRDGVVDQFFALTNTFMFAPIFTSRDAWFDKPGPFPVDVTRKMNAALNIGWWNTELVLYGDPDVNAAKETLVMRALGRRSSVVLDRRRWTAGEPLDLSNMSTPTTAGFQIINWYGGRGGHMAFSPVVPARADDLIAHVRANQRLFEAAGRDFTCANHVNARYVISINELFFDRDDAPSRQNVQTLFKRLVEAAAGRGYGEYRTHLDWMDDVAETFDFNDHALRRLNELVKDALDPDGVLAPGKSGVWPQRYRGERGN